MIMMSIIRVKIRILRKENIIRSKVIAKITIITARVSKLKEETKVDMFRLLKNQRRKDLKIG